MRPDYFTLAVGQALAAYVDPHLVPVALRQVTEGLGDLSVAITRATDVQACFRIYHELEPLIQAAMAMQTRALRRADDLLKEQK